ncbi:MAG TPA: histidine--tRNA ligase [Clostridia bacterium]|nr:histidine--tRNA ligase [Clostridia bacterium]
MAIKAPRGTRDVLPGESYKWHYVEDMFRKICSQFGYCEIRTPVFENTELFQRGVGETTDVVQKEMYTFEDRGGRSITLKPEVTAPVVRAYIEHKLYADVQPVKAYYATPCFRYERPQSGRLRAFHQFGIEILGSPYASADADVISLAMLFFERLGLKGLELRINSVGCPKCRKEYGQRLREFLKDKLPLLCETCNNRYHTNPMRIIDCKEDKCKKTVEGIPLMLDYVCDECRDHFESLKEHLENMGLEYIVDPTIVRGLDYYTKTAFEIVSQDIGSQGTVCGGGRYDGLVEECGGPSTPGIGFGLGIERLLLIMESQGIEIQKEDSLDLFVASIGDRAVKKAVSLVYSLRAAGVAAECDHMGRSLRAQMKYADKLGVRYTMVLGDDELEKGVAAIKDMSGDGQMQAELNAQKIKQIILK